MLRLAAAQHRLCSHHSAQRDQMGKGGWWCDGCNFHNYGFRSECMRCGCAAPASAIVGAAPAGGRAPHGAWAKGPGAAGSAGHKGQHGHGGAAPHSFSQEEVRCYAAMDATTWDSVKKYLAESNRERVQKARDQKDQKQQPDAREATRIQDKLAGQLQAATKREAKAVEAARGALLEVAKAKAKVAELSQQLADASEKAAAEFAKAAGRDAAVDGDSPAALAKQLRGTLGQSAANDPGADLLRKLLDKLDPPAPSAQSAPPQSAPPAAEAPPTPPASQRCQVGCAAAGVQTKKEDGGVAPAEEVDLEPDQVDAAFDALDVADLLSKCDNEALRKRLQCSISGLREQLKRPRRL